MNRDVVFYSANNYLEHLDIFRGLPAEFVTSAYLVKENKVCLINHIDLKLWLPPGGHLIAEPEPEKYIHTEDTYKAVFKETLHEATLREVREETGWNSEIVDDRKLYSEDGKVYQIPSPRFVQYELIREEGRPEHVHVNFVYFCRPTSYAEKPSGDEGQIEWFGLHDLDELENLFPHTRMNAIAAILELGSIVPDCLKVDNGRVLVPIGGRCAYKCLYCYTKRHDVYFGEPNPSKTATLVKEICELHPSTTITAQLGYDNDPFELPDLGLDIITRLTWLPVHIGFSTKAFISKKTAKALSILRRIKNESGMNLSGLVTLTSLETASKLEPFAPTPHKRLESVKNLTEEGIPTLINLRPLLPDDVSNAELSEILYLAKESGALGVVIGAFWVDPEQIVLSGLAVPSSDGKRQQAPWSPHGLEWIRYEDPEAVRRIAETCDKIGLKVFMSSADAVGFLNDKIC